MKTLFRIFMILACAVLVGGVVFFIESSQNSAAGTAGDISSQRESGFDDKHDGHGIGDGENQVPGIAGFFKTLIPITLIVFIFNQVRSASRNHKRANQMELRGSQT